MQKMRLGMAATGLEREGVPTLQIPLLEHVQNRKAAATRKGRSAAKYKRRWR